MLEGSIEHNKASTRIREKIEVAAAFVYWQVHVETGLGDRGCVEPDQ